MQVQIQIPASQANLSVAHYLADLLTAEHSGQLSSLDVVRQLVTHHVLHGLFSAPFFRLKKSYSNQQ